MTDKTVLNPPAQFIDTFFRPDLIEKYSGAIGNGIIITCEVAFLVVCTGIFIGLILAIIRTYDFKYFERLGHQLIGPTDP